MEFVQLDLLAFSSHPDDVELAAGGSMIRHAQLGWKTGIVDFTRGEMGTRGTAELRDEESKVASSVLGLTARENLKLEDCFFHDTKETLLKVISAIRRYRPRVVLICTPSDRHPDHGRAAKIQADACFYSGLIKIDTGEQPWRPEAVYHYIQDRWQTPGFVVDVGSVWEKKMEAVMAYKSQFYDAGSSEPVTPISTQGFLEFLKGRAMQFGRLAGVELGEGFIPLRTPLVDQFDALR